MRLLTSLWLIMAVAAGLRFGYAWYEHRTIPTENLRGRLLTETGNIAYSLVNGKGFSSPWRLASGPTAQVAPAYPLLLAGIYKVFGAETIGSFFAAASLNILFSVAACVPIFYAGKRIAGAAVGTTAAWFWAVLPNAVVLPVNWIWDTSLSALLAAGLLWATLWVAESPRSRNWCGYGLLWGLALLTNPVLGSLLPFLLGWAAWRLPGSLLPRLQRMAIALGCAVLCCLPWTVRNYVEFHKFIPMRSALGFSLYLQNNENYDEHPRPWPFNVTREREYYRFFRIGEAAFMDEEMHKALSFMASHPRTEVRLCAYRFLSFWTGSAQPLHDFRAADLFLRAVFVSGFLLVLGMLSGLAILYRRHDGFFFPLVSFPLIYPLIYYVTNGQLRYRHPLDPVLVLLLALPLGRLRAYHLPMRKTALLFVATALVCTAQTSDMAKLTELSKKPQSPEFEQALKTALKPPAIQKGTAWLGEGPDFFFAVEAASQPELYVDDQPNAALKRIGKSDLWYAKATLTTGRSHSFYYKVAGAKFGGQTDVPCYGPESYEKPGVPRGKLSDKMVFHSHIYEGMECNYWIYVPAQYKPDTPAALFVWQDGQGLVQRDGATRSQIVFDNLTAEGKIPVMIQVYIQPGLVGTKAMRSIEYDSVNDTYARFLRDEILPEVYKNYNIRKDGYSRAIGGNSSGGICAFNTAWQQNDQFTRVLSRIGSFTSIQWHPGELDGGNVYPFKIRKEPKRNIRVWLQDGSEDLENQFGSWPLQSLQMANSLKIKDYDFHLSFGNGTHNGAHGNSELPEELIWLWRGYDPAKTDQQFTMEDEEKAKPFFRVRPYNR